MRADAEVGVALEREAVEVADRVLQLLGEIRVAFTRGFRRGRGAVGSLGGLGRLDRTLLRVHRGAGEKAGRNEGGEATLSHVEDCVHSSGRLALRRRRQRFTRLRRDVAPSLESALLGRPQKRRSVRQAWRQPPQGHFALCRTSTLSVLECGRPVRTARKVSTQARASVAGVTDSSLVLDLLDHLIQIVSLRILHRRVQPIAFQFFQPK